MEREEEEEREERRKKLRYVMRTTEEFAVWMHGLSREELRKCAPVEYNRLVHHYHNGCLHPGCRERLKELLNTH